MATVEYNLDGDSSSLVSETEQAITAMAGAEDQAEDTTVALNKLTAAEKRAADGAKAARKEFGENVATVKHLGEMFKFGAEVAASLVSGFVGLVRSAVDARKEMKEFLSVVEQRDLEGLASDLEAADTAGTLLQQTIASSLSPEIEKLINVVIGAVDHFGDFMEKLDEVRDSDAVVALREVSSIFLALGTLGASEAIFAGMDQLAESGEVAAESINEVLDAKKELAKQEAEALADILAGAKAQADADKAAAKSAAEAQKLHDARVKAVEDGATRETEANAKAREAQKAADEAYAEFRYGLWHDTLTDELSDLQAFTDAAIDLNQKELDDWTKAQETKREKNRETANSIGENWLSLGETLAGIWQQNATDHADRLDEQRADLRSQLKDAEGDERDLLKTRIRNNKELADEERKHARQAFAVSQAAAVGSVLLSGAMAFAALTANLAYLTWGAPIAAAAIAGPVTVGQLAVVANAKGPAHDGVSFGADEFFVGDQMVRQNEKGVIFNQRAVEDGAVDRAMADNRGEPRGADGQALVLADAGRVFATAALRDARRPGSPFAVGSDGVSNPFRKGR